MRIKLVIMMLFILLLVIPAQSFQGQTDTSLVIKGVVNATNVNVRKGPSIKKQIVGKIPYKNTVVDVIDCKGVWYRIRVDSIAGWMHGNFITLRKNTPACMPAIVTSDDESSIRDIIYAWRDAWKRKDMDTHMSFYSPDFRSKAFDYQGLLDEKTTIFQNLIFLSVDISDPDIRFDGKHAIATFQQKYECLYGSDFCKKKLILAQRNGTWKIVSEELEKPEKPSPVTSGKPNTSDLKDAIIVKSIRFRIDKDKTEKVFIDLSRFYIPQIIALEGKKPRIAIDIPNITSWSERNGTVSVKGQLIKRIRTHLHRDSETLRIVLDLDPEKNFKANPIYYEAENIYCIVISDSY